MSAREVLDGIKARLTAATPGPWKTEPVESGSFAHIPRMGKLGRPRRPTRSSYAAAPSDVARLAAAVEAVLGLADLYGHTIMAQDVRAAIENALKP